MSTTTEADILLERGELLPAARALCREGRHEEAADVFVRICMESEAAGCAEHSGDPVRAHRLLLEARDWSGAATLRGRFLRDDAPGTDGILLEMAQAMVEAGLDADAAPLLEAMGEMEAAQRAYRAAAELRGAARLEMALGRPDQAALLLRAWLDEPERKASKEDRGARLMLARALVRSRQREQAILTLQDLLSQQPQPSLGEQEQALALLVSAFHDMGHSAAAEEVFGVLRVGLGLPDTDYRGWLHGRTDPLEDTWDDGTERVIGGRYRLGELLGAGGTGQVFRAVDELSGREVAVKLVFGGGDGPALFRFFREARVAEVLEHPGLVRVLRAEPEHGYLIMEYLSGGTLADRLRGGRRLSLNEARDLGLALCDVLAAIHRRGILHRDLKPENILYDAAGRPRLADLGAAHLFSFRQTESGFLLGTLAFMAPEQLSGHRPSAATDIFALGVTLYTALTGRLPFPGPDIAEQQRQGAPPPSSLIEDLGPAIASIVDEVLLAALRANPEERIGEAKEMQRELMRLPQLPARGQLIEEVSTVEVEEDRASVAPKTGTTRYRVSARVGARVSLARDAVLMRAVALERFPADGAHSWLERLGRIAESDNPRIQGLLDIEPERELAVWQWVEGEDFETWASGNDRSLGEALRVGADLAGAMVDHPGPIDARAILVHRGRAMVVLAGSESLRTAPRPLGDVRPAIGRFVGWARSGVDPGETVGPLDEAAGDVEAPPTGAAELSVWLALRAASL